ncbi:MAG: type pilus modification protein PilV [Pseudomonadota bacterium]|jgi:type IV pilus assembly protein PilV
MSLRSALPVSRQRGATLVEILVAVVILSLGLLGLASLQIRAMRGSHSSVQRTQAVILSHSLLDLMRVDRASALQGDYNTTRLTPSGRVCAPLTTVPTGLAQTEFQGWFALVKSQLGRPLDQSTCADVSCDAQGLCTVRLQWDDSASGGLPNQHMSVSTRL